MRTNIVIDDDLMADVLRVGGFTTKREAVESALRAFLNARAEDDVRALRGRLRWEGDLDAMRTNDLPDEH